jgi:hypothetical protein
VHAYVIMTSGTAKITKDLFVIREEDVVFTAKLMLKMPWRTPLKMIARRY